MSPRSLSAFLSFQILPCLLFPSVHNWSLHLSIRLFRCPSVSICLFSVSHLPLPAPSPYSCVLQSPLVPLYLPQSSPMSFLLSSIHRHLPQSLPVSPSLPKYSSVSCSPHVSVSLHNYLSPLISCSLLRSPPVLLTFPSVSFSLPQSVPMSTRLHHPSSVFFSLSLSPYSLVFSSFLSLFCLPWSSISLSVSISLLQSHTEPDIFVCRSR